MRRLAPARSCQMVDDPFVFCCENALPPMFGMHNFYATLTTIPMWFVPLAALRDALGQSVDAEVLTWLSVLTTLFLAGTIQHAVGPESTPPMLNPVPLGIAQNALLFGCLTRLPRMLSATVAATPVAVAACWPSWRKIVCDAMDAALSPCVILIMGYRSWNDPCAWRLFFRAFLSFVGLVACTALEPKLCGLPGAEFFHAIAIHLCISLLFGHVATLALRLLERPKMG